MLKSKDTFNFHAIVYSNATNSLLGGIQKS